jgi:hypothetical protein
MSQLPHPPTALKSAFMMWFSSILCSFVLMGLSDREMDTEISVLSYTCSFSFLPHFIPSPLLKRHLGATSPGELLGPEMR